MGMDIMTRFSKKELKDYIKGRIKAEGLSDMCEEIIFESKFPGLITIFEIEKFMIVNIPKFYSTLENDDIRGNLANLIILQAVEHEIEHLRLFKVAHKERKNDDKSFTAIRSFNYSMSNIVYSTIPHYFSLYHEYDADISSISRLLTDKEFLDRATYDRESDLFDFNEHMARRILKRYRVDENNTSPIGLFLDKAYDQNGFLTSEEYDRISGYLGRREDNLSNLLLGKDVTNDTIQEIEFVSEGRKQTKNILRLVK